ncbi:carbon-nitrogen hydrolase family protein [Cronobacter sakazakii]|uniref:carbon-nitrogen hydrolase family protein n=2 Tax=Enterobacteriaceae TaxID=543 RepID=UPI000B7E5F2E|nr:MULTISPECIES: carbon-nitrogen hydrolase family protein [Enterobacteriaceae]ECQ2317065.1 carbon-nitrogen hydrolase family protein [Salmonella enterica]ECU4129789.1 carbon-nitrogen hydrolase family protein [Salmonella enterica subsp. enterica serovar Havana]STS63178.1 carbon-nitrogen hydrolase [Klebsiella aerogenes]HBQ6014584.1 carbon-nitrogen hydrolase family protein [Klebsiella pneumoniae subsp. pneumoniae]EFB3355119.1 carbon-nitrogen hydrolase family protein [Escherichia coli]
MMNKPVTVACVQAAPVFMDLEGTIDKTVTLISEAARKGAELIAFPETWIPGYPWFLWLNSPATNMPLVYQYHQNSLVLDSAQAKRIADAAQQNNIVVVLGFSERDHGSLYISQWLIGSNGETIGIRRKLKATHVERTLFGESDGSSLTTWETPLGNVGALCCWEHLQPLSRYAMYSQHEEIHIAAWPSFSLYTSATAALGPEVNTAASRLYAAEGQCFVIAPCAVVSDEMIDFLCPDDDRRALLSAGGGHARIYGPDGRELVTPLGENEEGLLIAELDSSAITFAKLAADPVGHYSRPDVTRLLFNPSVNKTVIKRHSPPELIAEQAAAEEEEE